jgi:hypothetical protein
MQFNNFIIIIIIIYYGHYNYQLAVGVGSFKYYTTIHFITLAKS